MPYCDTCGLSHRIDKCKKMKGKKKTKKIPLTRATRRTAVEEVEGSRSVSRESSPELVSRMQTLSLEDQERALQKEIADMSREERIAELQAQRDEMRGRKEGRLLGSTPLQREGRAPVTTGAIDAITEHSDYGLARSRRRSRTRRRRRTLSDSRSRSSSSTRRRRSKWSLRRYAVLGKELKKLNCYELVTASIRWCLDIEGLTVKDFRAFLEHICFMSSRARQNDFHDSTHIEYDKDIRKLAEVEGFAAFGTKNTGVGMFHYGMHNMRQRKSVGAVRKTSSYTKDGKLGCFKWNKEAGCSRTDEVCNFGHWCSKCGSKSHKKYNCAKD